MGGDGAMMNILAGFHHQVVRRIAEMMARRTMRGEWYYPQVAEALETTGLWPIKEYIQRSHANVALQVACWTIYELHTG